MALFFKNNIIQSTFLLFAIALLGFSCNSTKYLKDNELLLTKNSVELEVPELSKDERSNLSYQLWTTTKQKPNAKFLGIRHRLWAYNEIQKDFQKDTLTRDTSRFQKWVLNNFAEKPVLFNRTLMESSVQTMEFYLNNKGYFYATVTADSLTKPKSKKVEVVYRVKAREPLLISEVKFETEDKNIQPFLPLLQQKTLLRPTEPVSKTLFNNERNRISKALQNQGFTYFYPNYIFFEGDSTQNELKSKVKVTIVTPNDTTFHQQYTIGNIYIYTDYNPVNRANLQFDTLSDIQEGFYLIKDKEKEAFIVKPRPILNCFTLKKGDPYSADAFETTRKQLVTLNVYKFVRIKPIPQDSAPNVLDFIIYLNPSKKMEFGADLELNTIRGNSTIGDAIGIFGNLNYRNRNIFRGAELFTLNPVIGFEFAIDQPDRIFNTIDIRVQSELAFPVIRNGLFKGAQSKIAASYSYISRIQLYRYNLLTGSAGFDWNYSNYRHIFNPISVNFLTPTIAPEFQPTLNANPFLDRSFDRQLIVGSNYSYQYGSPVNRSGETYTFRLNSELVGNSLWALDQFIDPASSFMFFDSISYSQYTRLDLEGTYTKRYTRNTSLALRLNTGIGFAYGNASEMPYVKQFYSGGTSGVRAWRVRELGPGTFYDPSASNVIPYQTGDVKLEFNAELRFMLLSSYAIQGAFFIDGGNVWTLKEDPDRPGSQISGNFWNEIAIGSGFGVRRDFSYFIIRLDLAFKIMTPYSDPANLYADRFLPPQYWQPVWNLAIGYPF